MHNHKNGMDDLRLEIANEILKRIPNSFRPVEYLMDTLGYSRDAIYRRLKGNIPFTFEEIIILADKLNFSLDEILMKQHASSAIFNFINDRYQNPEESFIEMFSFFVEQVKETNRSPHNQKYVVINRLLTTLVFRTKNLLKFRYYKWLHQYKNVPFNISISDIEIPEKLIELREEAINHFKYENIVYIIDRKAFFNSVCEIKYFIERGLMTGNEIELIKEDLYSILDTFQEFFLRGYSREDSKYEIYLSLINIQNNSVYTVCDGLPNVYLWINSDYPIHTTDVQFCTLHKNWTESLIKHSVLISQSNQKMQEEFYNQAWMEINELSNCSKLN